MEILETLQAPYPWFGGKSRVADIVWRRFGRVQRYLEPFFGSGAVLLGAPYKPSLEVANDLDGNVANFWRAIKSDPKGVAKYADGPVTELDIMARYKWLLSTGAKRIKQLQNDPDFFDAKVAGWWVYGVSAWIGGGWLSGGNVNAKLPRVSGLEGIHRQVRGTASIGRSDALAIYFEALAQRLQNVTVASGQWDRIVISCLDTQLTGVFLDPPYPSKDHVIKYAANSDVFPDVQKWCIENGDNPKLRIALCGYTGPVMPKAWKLYRWRAVGGYGNLGASDGAGRINAGRECIWFSPHCIHQTLF